MVWTERISELTSCHEKKKTRVENVFDYLLRIEVLQNLILYMQTSIVVHVGI